MVKRVKKQISLYIDSWFLELLDDYCAEESIDRNTYIIVALLTFIVFNTKNPAPIKEAVSALEVENRKQERETKELLEEYESACNTVNKPHDQVVIEMVKEQLQRNKFYKRLIFRILDKLK